MKGRLFLCLWALLFSAAGGPALMQAYAAAGIDVQHTFIIGENAGAEGTVAIAEEDYLQHAAEQLPQVEAVCEFR